MDRVALRGPFLLHRRIRSRNFICTRIAIQPQRP